MQNEHVQPVIAAVLNAFTALPGQTRAANDAASEHLYSVTVINREGNACQRTHYVRPFPSKAAADADAEIHIWSPLHGVSVQRLA
jgi:hypothetical protein